MLDAPVEAAYILVVCILLLGIAIEWLYAAITRKALLQLKDTLTNLVMYAGFTALTALWTLTVFEAYSLAHQYRLFDMGPGWMDWTSWQFWVCWLSLFVLEDFTFYWFHRVSHRSRLFWASHITHHSSECFNYSVALRQTWVPFTSFPFWLWLPLLGFDPLMVMAQQLINLAYQGLLHTSMIGSLGPIEWVLNTPRHQEVHHGSNPQYIDKNYAGTLIIWDRFFASFAKKGEPVIYGITKNIHSFNPFVIAFHEWYTLIRDLTFNPNRLRTAFTMPPSSQQKD